VSERVSKIILLCEDDPQEQLVRSYLKQCGLNTVPPGFFPRNASREVHGGNVGWVLNEFPRELEACRHRHENHANTLLIVIVDADDNTVAERRGHLNQKLQMTGADPIVVLIPKRHIETWIRCALGVVVDENTNYKKPEPKKTETRAAAGEIHGWARANPAPSATCVDSLRKSLSEWRKIG
jgi:hypothetical protein